MPQNFLHLLDQNLGNLHYILPEIPVVVPFLVALFVDMLVPAGKSKLTGYVCALGLLAALWFNMEQNSNFIHYPATSLSAFSGMLIHDHFGTFVKFPILLGTVFSILAAIHAKELSGKNHGEYFLLLLAVCVGGMFLASASNLLMIYLSLESLSVVSYAMAGYLRRDRRSAEAGIKYVIYGAMASGIMIFGMSYLYGLCGTLNLFGGAAVAA